MTFFYILKMTNTAKTCIAACMVDVLPCKADVESSTLTLAFSFHFFHFQGHILWCTS